MFVMKTSRFCYFNASLKWMLFHNNTIKSLNMSGLVILLHDVISLPDAMQIIGLENQISAFLEWPLYRGFTVYIPWR